MSERRWKAGDSFTLSGVRWRVVQGRYFVGDLRLEWLISGRWVPVQMVLMAVHADFYGENEDARYPNGLGYRKYTRWCELAATQGWQAAHAQMLQEVAKRRASDA